ncbi:MAG: tRNA (guanosine(46)-N7)-methyltransferase TrmB [Saprospiraceae bacterium]
MGRKNKLKKFAEIRSYPNVVENRTPNPEESSDAGENDPRNLRGQWSKSFFRREAPIVLELACGKGEYTVALAQQYPDDNFIGVDIKGARIWKGATKALALQLQNAGFLRTRIEQLDEFFAPGEVHEIWITFPDPYLRKSHAQKRLTSDRFLAIYRNLLTEGSRIQLKTDDPTLFDFTKATWHHAKDLMIEHCVDDIYGKTLVRPELEIKTFYEKMHLEAGKTIKYISAIYRPV